MPATEPPGDFDYLWEDLGDFDDDYGFDDYHDEPYQTPARPAPWYRTTGALLAICAIIGAIIAILVSAILLMSRDTRGPAHDIMPSPAATPSSAPATPPPRSGTVPPGLSSTASPRPSESTSSAPVVVTPPHEVSTPPTTLGGTSTPVTRSPMSVHPEPHPAFPHY